LRDAGYGGRDYEHSTIRVRIESRQRGFQECLLPFDVHGPALGLGLADPSYLEMERLGANFIPVFLTQCVKVPEGAEFGPAL